MVVVVVIVRMAVAMVAMSVMAMVMATVGAALLAVLVVMPVVVIVLVVGAQEVGVDLQLAFRLKPRRSKMASIGASPKCAVRIGARGFMCSRRWRSSATSGSPAGRPW